MELFTKRWKKLSLSKKEGCKADLAMKAQVPHSCSKFMIRRTLNVEAMVRTFRPLWRTRMGFQVRNMGEHKLLC